MVEEALQHSNIDDYDDDDGDDDEEDERKRESVEKVRVVLPAPRSLPHPTLV